MTGQSREPTLQTIMKRLRDMERNADKRDRRTAWLTLMAVSAGFVAAGEAYINHNPWILIAVGIAGGVIGLLGVLNNWRIESNE